MNYKNTKSFSLDSAEAALGTIVRSVSADGSCGGPWAHELTPAVKCCGVVTSGRSAVLQVNPAWLGELMSRHELGVLANEMRTWFAIRKEAVRLAA